MRLTEPPRPAGSEWVKEDTIMLHNVPLPRLYTPADASTSLLEAGGHRCLLAGDGAAAGDGDGDDPKGEGELGLKMGQRRA